ncbi:glucose/quinate/shikimate family membrane-bound PQQ-dependent dehydrogenase [Limoniibacter endophyticus]|uniref:Quinoprotein glucose dehydrogenase n=1 Tax=Limoniibacter endophyticus TaxID=1565040 RepID=A0A8J3GHI0_9HYPH|nr:glucose/quinate/shikimate family membrane-bound PQQ-dependent dehydrogenase [Limoniibacter endophyticus]GHC72332.1 quinoprotein glucose dehydrogenase [Limoniibacter endophyticus]
MTTFTGLLFGIIALIITLMGGWLIALGGSPAYLFLGLAILLTAWLVLRRSGAATVVFSITLVLWLGWAIWEVGFDWWKLAPRGGLVVLMAIWLWLPFVRNRLVGTYDTAPERRAGGTSGLPLAAAILLSICAAAYSMSQDPTRIEGELPGKRIANEPNTGNPVPPGEWHQYGRTNYGQRWSPLDTITPENVAQLEEVWRYQTGDVKRPDDVSETTYQVTPLKIDNRLYLCTPHNIAIALDAATGREVWRYDAQSGMNPDRQHQTCRGVTYWDTGAAPATEGPACVQRVYMPTADARLLALDAETGELCTSFAEGGTLRLERGMPYNPAGYYYSTSPPVAVNGLLIIGGAVNDNFSIYSQSGVIRAYDILTGELRWNWDSGNPDDTAPINVEAGETYTANSPNSWSVFSVDEQRGLVYIPLGNQVPDQLGMGRSPAVEEHSSSIVALDVNSGQRRWVFQTVHHDLWDMDVPAQPVLIDLERDGQTLPALVGPTKQGDIYVLNRETGEPILSVSEEPAPGGAIPEDFTAPTQPTSALTLKPEPLRERDMWGVSIFDQLYCRIQFHQLKYEGRYTPPSLQGTIVYPGNFGTFNWGSVAVDPERQVMFGMPTYLAFTSRLVPRADIPPKEEGETASEQGLNRNEGAPYGVVMGPFLGPLGIPCQSPPWGYVAGADLTNGQVAWMHKNGTVRDMSPVPLPIKMGVPGIGGPIITRGGVAFLGAAVDDYLRAYDLTTGEQLWQARLPAGGQSTPMTYEQDDRQYVLIVAGGHGSVGTKPGDYVIAYALPE